MHTYLDCIPCLMRQSLEAARRVTDDESIHEQILHYALRTTAALDLNQPPPVIGQVIHRKLREIIGVDDPYRAAKDGFNRVALALLPELAALVEQHPDPLLAAARLAIAANVIDLGVNGTLTQDEARASLLDAFETPFRGDTEGFREAVAGAADILYLADNAGEIAVDRLLLEQLGPQRVTVVVRGGPVINDATWQDARDVGLTELVEVIDNGSDAPGTVLDDCSPAFRKRFEEADVVLAKGQGNFETLSHVERPVIFGFKVKCPLVAGHVGMENGTLALVVSQGTEPV